ncbi:hypothetical protein KKF05_04585 [Patescibacteria group bacterium]|nr:hypothetical protein [Patescibacteria group bacterium]MBU1029107.1 hypothetical protein [Patescibacteria group bacterium]MBU1916011.1 hypothetical protein [Patescibacteria group bacterium]
MEDLSRYSTEELQAELARRGQTEREQPVGADWYYLPIEDDESVFIGLVHRRFWHRHHSLRDQHISRLVKLPPGFAEVMESRFEHNGSYEEACRLLEYLGYRPAPIGGGLVVHITEIAGRRMRVDCICDTDEQRAIFDSHSKTRRGFHNEAEYRRWIESLVPGTVLEIYPDRYESGFSACLMNRTLAKSLPPHPEGIRD